VVSTSAGPPPALAGELRISGSVLPGTRTEWLPFPCHPREHAFLAELDPATPVQYWERTCGTEGCGIEYRFEHRGRQIRWQPIVELTDPGSPQAVPLDRYKVEARLLRERDGNPFKTLVPVTHARELAGRDRVPRFIRRLTTAHF
jgi:hypothetical protein